MFRMAQKLNEDTCFKCKLKIEKIEQFTIEHKKPWVNTEPKLFWDLENIAFSHSRCNTANRPWRGGNGNRIDSPLGLNWCSRHRKFLSVEQFGKDNHHRTGLRILCKECEQFVYRTKKKDDKAVTHSRPEDGSGANSL